MPVELIVDDDVVFDHKIADIIEAAYTAAATHIDRLAAEVCIRICERAASQALNREYRERDNPTNVLSFPAEVDLPAELSLLGDIALCWPIVITEAQVQGKPLTAHAAHLTVHGVLHLAGYDHQDEAEAEEMEAMECTILARLNIANPYL